jgi:DNA repair protein RecO (recombination protein O)
MLHKTRGIVFRFTKYGDTSIIVTIFTELFGLQTYIVNGVRSSSAKSKIALYQPLTLLDLVVYHKENASILRIKEVKCAHPYSTLYQDVKKSAMAMFINELINKTIKDESHAAELHGFISASLVGLDEASSNYENFHLVFLIKLSRLLGFGVHNAHEILGNREPNEKITMLLTRLIGNEYFDPINMTLSERRIILDLILSFFHTHIDTMGEIKSVAVLKEVLS